MMGTLSSFAGLVTFLFVASGDVPKVPYQTRLDTFMTFSFVGVAPMLPRRRARACPIARTWPVLSTSSAR